MTFIKELFNDFLSILKTFQFNDLIDIILVTLIIFSLFRILRQTRAAQVVKGLVILAIAYVVSMAFDLTMVGFVMTTIFEFGALILVIVFQPELRRTLEHIGRKNLTKKSLFNVISNNDDDLTVAWNKAINDVADASVSFGKSKVGALIVFERDTILTEIANSGIRLDSETSVALLGNIFFINAPLHDGACILRDGKILSAGCILPLTDNTRVNSSLGTRHRAAIGISEETDAVVVVVSEETGIVSLAVNGRLIRNLSREDLVEELTELIIPDSNDKQELFAVFSRSRKENKDEE